MKGATTSCGGSVKQLKHDFLDRARWPWVWGGIAVLLLALVSFTWHQNTRLGAVAQQRSSATASVLRDVEVLKADQVKALEAANDPRSKSLRVAESLLRQDVNPVFTALENVQVPGTRLISFNIEGGIGAIRADYESENIAQISELTAALNAGYTRPVWHFQSLSSNTASHPNAGGGAGFRASWTGSLSDLK